MHFKYCFMFCKIIIIRNKNVDMIEYKRGDHNVDTNSYP